MVAQWLEHSPPTNVDWVQIPASTPYVGWVCCWFSPLLREVFSGYSGFPLSSKTNISKFQFDQESGRRRTTMWLPSNRYLFIFIHFIQLPNSVKCRLIVLTVKEVLSYFKSFYFSLSSPTSGSWRISKLEKTSHHVRKNIISRHYKTLDLLLSNNILKVHKLKAKTTYITQQLTILNTEGNIFLSLLTY